MTKRHYQLITFDLDNTLWDIEPVVARAEEVMFDWLAGQCPDITRHFDVQGLRTLKSQLQDRDEQYRHQLSRLRTAMAEQALLRSGYDADQAHQVSRQAFALFLDHRNRVEYFPFALPTLALLKKQYRLAALTNGNACLQRLGLDHVFEFIVSAEAINASKPAPDHFHHALERAGVTADRVIHIGDHAEHDIWAARQLGIKTIWVNFHHLPWPSALGPAPALQCDSLASLPALVARLESQAL